MKNLILLASIFAFVGCASTGGQTTKKESVLFVKGSKSQVKSEVSNWAKCKVPKKANINDWKAWVDNVNVCVKDSKWSRVDSYSTKMLEKFPDSPWGVYFSSLSAEKKGNNIRANWMIDRALKMTPEVGLFHFQKARLLLKDNEKGVARAQFERAFQLDDSLSEAAIYLAKASYSDEDFSSVNNYLAKVPSSMMDEDLKVIKMESARNLKDFDLALDLAKELSRKYTKNFHYGLRLAQLLEEFPEKRKQALQQYQKVLKHAKKLGKSQKLVSSLPDKISNLKQLLARAEKEEIKKDK